MDSLKELIYLYSNYAEELIVWGKVLKIISRQRPNVAETMRLDRVIKTIIRFYKYLCAKDIASIWITCRPRITLHLIG